MKFLVDAQLPPALASWLCDQGHDARHVSDIGLLDASDAEIARQAEAIGATLLSKDADFVSIRLPDRFAFVWLRCGNATNRTLRLWLESRWPQVLTLLTAGERFVEVR